MKMTLLSFLAACALYGQPALADGPRTPPHFWPGKGNPYHGPEDRPGASYKDFWYPSDQKDVLYRGIPVHAVWNTFECCYGYVGHFWIGDSFVSVLPWNCFDYSDYITVTIKGRPTAVFYNTMENAYGRYPHGVLFSDFQVIAFHRQKHLLPKRR
jgi:hypothetical protein